MRKRVSSLIFLVLFAALVALASAGCGNDGEIVVRDPDPQPTRTAVPE